VPFVLSAIWDDKIQTGLVTSQYASIISPRGRKTQGWRQKVLCLPSPLHGLGKAKSAEPIML